MKAIRYIAAGQPPEVVDLPIPQPGPGQVLIKIAAAGVCHSDLHILEHGDRYGFGHFTLGHENSGWVAALGAGVHGWKEGQAVAVYGPWGCGHCRSCQHSAENYCEQHASLPVMGGGLGADGGMAEYMLIPSPRLLVPLGSLDPVLAAPLTDAALTPYHAIKTSLPRLTPDACAIIIGIGGLGHMAAQLLQAMAPARLIACDIDPAKLALARELGIEYLVDSRDSASAVEAIRAITGPRGAAAVFDFVGNQPTIDLGQRVLGRNSRFNVVGLGGGSIHYSANNPPFGCEVNIPYWGSRTELMEVIALAHSGRIHTEVESFPLTEAAAVYQRLQRGEIRGRAVLIP